MRCRPSPGSRFYSLDRLLRRRGCWEPLYDLITPPLRRGRNARRRSGIRHVLAPPPAAPPSQSPVKGPFHGWTHPTLRCLSLHSLLYLFLVFQHLKGATATFSKFSLPNKMASTGQPTQPTWRCLRLQRALTPLTK